MKISVKLEASQCTGHVTFTLNDLNFSLEEWEALSDEDKEAAIKDAIYELPEQPFWMLDSFTEN